MLEHSAYVSIREKTVLGRYLINEQILKFLETAGQQFVVTTIGNSVQGRPIKGIVLGTGPIKILMWSQMHGNESTTTKSVLDLINFLGSKSNLAVRVLKHCTIQIIPMLNPDGAEAYTRVNANEFDLNRDAQKRTQPESVVLRKVYDEFRPDYCFNLHDQRTIFNVGDTSKPATVSFLAPAHDEERSISTTRSISMQLIVAMNFFLQRTIPGRVGRYDDGFNANCVGDTFQMLGTPTILFEAGHSPKDYDREETRVHIFQAILNALSTITENKIDDYGQEDYFSIPENGKRFYDVLIKNAHIAHSSIHKDDSIGLLYKEVLANDKIKFVAQVDKTGNLADFFGHVTYDCVVNEELIQLRGQSFFGDMISKL